MNASAICDLWEGVIMLRKFSKLHEHQDECNLRTFFAGVCLRHRLLTVHSRKVKKEKLLARRVYHERP